MGYGAMGVRTDHPLYKNDSFNHVLGLYSFLTIALFTNNGINKLMFLVLMRQLNDS